MEIIKLNLIPTGSLPVVHTSQYDDGRVFRAELYEGAAVYTLDGTEVLECDVKKPDGNIVTIAVVNTSDNYVDVETTLQMNACAGESFGELHIKKGAQEIGTLNFILAVERSPLENGIQSDSGIHNLQTQIGDAVADQYAAEDVVFDATPTAGHGVGFAVTSEGILAAIPEELDDLQDVTTSSPTSGEALVWDGSKWTNGTVSTVGSIDDLNDVDTTGKGEADSLRYDSTAQEWKAQKTKVFCTQAEYDALELGGNLAPQTDYIITDGVALEYTANDLSYDGGATTTKQIIDGLTAKFGELPTEIRCGGGNYSGLKGGGHANRVSVPITFSSPMTGTQYAVFIVISDAYSDYPYIQGYCFGGSRTTSGFTATILSMSSDTVTEVSGSFYWVAVRYK